MKKLGKKFLERASNADNIICAFWNQIWKSIVFNYLEDNGPKIRITGWLIYF